MADTTLGGRPGEGRPSAPATGATSPPATGATSPPATGEPSPPATGEPSAVDASEARPTPGRLRVHHGELASAGSALLLLALMFLTKWYGVAGVPDPSAARPAITTEVNAWHSLSAVRWVMLVTIAAALGSVVLRASQRTHGTKTDTSRVLTALGSVTFALLVDRVLIDLPASSEVIDQKLGAILGLLCALGIALGGYQSMRERQTLARRRTRRSRRRAGLASDERPR